MLLNYHYIIKNKILDSSRTSFGLMLLNYHYIIKNKILDSNWTPSQVKAKSKPIPSQIKVKSKSDQKSNQKAAKTQHFCKVRSNYPGWMGWASNQTQRRRNTDATQTQRTTPQRNVDES
jgi:hypothetical protein